MTIVASGTTNNQYIEGRIDYSTSILSDGKIRVTAILQMRRNNYPDYTGNTGGDYCTKAICISGDSTNFNYSGGTPLWIYGSDQNNWVEKFRATRDFEASRGGGQIYLGWKTEGNSYISGSRVQLITLPQGYTAPSTPSVSASNSSNTANSVTYGTSSFGNPSSGTVYLYGGTSASPTSQIASKTTTGNSSYSHTGLTGNTRYYYRSRVSNGQLWSSYSSETNVLTRPTTPSAVTLTVTGTTTATLKITSPSQGSSGTMTAYYKLNNGSYTSAGTITSGGTVTKNLTGLTAGTSYTATAYINNATANSGTKASSAVTTYKVPNNPTVSASNTSATANSITYGTTSFNTPSTGTVYLYGGTSASPSGSALTSKTSTGNSSYTHSGLTGNTKYYYRAMANNTGGNSGYSSDATAITRPANPTITINSLGHHTVSLSIKSPSQGSASTMTAYYKVDGGSATSAGTITSGGTKTVQLSFSPQTSHTVTAYLSNSSGNSGEATSTFTTKIPFCVPVSSQSRYAKKLYCSVNGKTKKVIHLYGSVNGVTKKIF